ncbi:hypothetical protein F8S20_32225 [Nostoc sp. BAE]|nr:hypothetical protein [Nostoc commune BAE]
MHCNTPPALSRSLTPLASPVGDAARTSRQSRPTQWLPLARGGLGRGLQLPQSDISFNYLGQLDLFSSQAWIHGIARESTGLLSHSQNSRHHKLNVTAWIAQSQLNVQWRYSRNLHDAATIERIAQQFIKALQTLIQHCQSPTSGGYTPSDFTGARLNQKQLDQFLSKLQQPKKG